jgi:hypothetical protein
LTPRRRAELRPRRRRLPGCGKRRCRGGDRLGSVLLDAAREAFTQRLQLTAITSAAIVVGMAILATVLLRDVRAGSELEGQPEPDGAIAGRADHKVLSPAAPVLEESCAREESQLLCRRGTNGFRDRRNIRCLSWSHWAEDERSPSA